MKKRVLIVVAQGVEELEAVAAIDLLRRANVDVTIAALGDSLDIEGRNSIGLKADLLLAEVNEEVFDGIVLPGGPAVSLLEESEMVKALLRAHFEADKWIGAICAAPLVLKAAGLLSGKQYTAHFSVKESLEALDGSNAVVVDGRIITSQGAGTAVEFGLTLVKYLVDEKTANEVAKSICYQA